MPTRKRTPATSPGKPTSSGDDRGGSARNPRSEAAPKPAGGGFRARVRMYRHGLGDCFLVTFPRPGRAPFQMLIDCGVLAGDTESMRRMVRSLRDEILELGPGDKARIDLVVATHEHRDHLSGFNQAREIFREEFDLGAVWLGWTENLTRPEIKAIKEARKRVVTKLQEALADPLAAAASDTFDGLDALLAFSSDDAEPGARTIAEALQFLKDCGKKAGALRYLEPGEGPIELDGVEGVRAYVLGPPRDPILLKGSEVTEQLKRDGVVYHLAATGEAGIDAICAALTATDAALASDGDRFHPFSSEHRIAPEMPDPLNPGTMKTNPFYKGVAPFVERAYDAPDQAWRRIDHDWLSAFGQLALDLDNDTNNTSLVLAFEFVETKEVLLFVGDAQVGNWRSWASVEFTLQDGRSLPAHELLRRTVFYKVGHHCSHNATLKKGGLELMTSDDLVAFVPLDRATAAKMGRKNPATGRPRGWDMPAPPLYKALMERTRNRVVISDASEPLTQEAQDAGIVATAEHIDYFLR